MAGSHTWRRVAHGFLKAGSDLASLEARLRESPCDMVELDVFAHRGTFVVAHDESDCTRPDLVPFDTALAVLRDHLPPTIGLNVDLKTVGDEHHVVSSLRRHDFADRSLVSTMARASLRSIRSFAPDIRLGWSVPKARRDYLSRWATKPLAYAGLAYYRLALPDRVKREISTGTADAVMAHWGVVTRRLCDAVSSVGGELYVWTIDDAKRLARLQSLDVTGVITNNLALFDGGTIERG